MKMFPNILSGLKPWRGLTITLSLVTALCNPALGETKADEKKGPVLEQLEAVTVTANKQEENVQDVPMSMSVLNGFTLEDKQIKDLNELGDFVPNLMIFSDGPTGINTPSMRGLHADAESLSVSTGLFIDEIPVSSTVGFANALLDVERIEVLRGPQGTLYGKNTEAGVINIITRLPDNEFRADTSAKLGSNTQSAAFSLSGPVKQDRLFFGVAGQYAQENGFITHTATNNEVDDRAYIYSKGQIRWTPGDDLEMRLIMSHIRHDNGAYRMGPNPDWWSAYFSSLPGERQVSSDHEVFGKAEESSQALKISYDISDALVFTTTTTHRIFDDIRAADVDLTSTDFIWRDFDSSYRTLTEELRLSYNAGGWKWLTGIYLDKNDYDILEQASSSSRDYDVNGCSYAIFGQATIPLTGQLSAVGGLRYEKQETEFTDNLTGTELDGSWDNISPKLAVEYRFSPQVMGYASAAKGFRSGGINYHWIDPDKITYESEKIWSYEVGAKSRMFNDRLLLNGAVYYMDIDDMQVYEGYPPMRLDISNSAKATGYGLELEIQARVTQAVILDASFGYSNVEFKDFTEAGVSYDGKKSPFAPEYTFNLGAQYRPGTGFYFRADLVGCGRMYLDKANTYDRDAYVLVNAKIGYEKENMDIYLYGKNIFDTAYDAQGYYGGMFTLYSNPRDIGIALAHRF